MKFQLEDDGYNNLLLGRLEMFLFEWEKQPKENCQIENFKSLVV